MFKLIGVLVVTGAGFIGGLYVGAKFPVFGEMVRDKTDKVAADLHAKEVLKERLDALIASAKSATSGRSLLDMGSSRDKTLDQLKAERDAVEKEIAALKEKK